MNSIEDLLTKDAQAIREDAVRYEQLKPDAPHGRRKKFTWCASLVLATAAGIAMIGMFRHDAKTDPSSRNEVAFAELQQLAAETLQWAERVAERKQQSNSVGRVERQLEHDRESLRRWLDAISTFGRNRDVPSLADTELAS